MLPYSSFPKYSLFSPPNKSLLELPLISLASNQTFRWQEHPVRAGPSMQKPPCLGTPDLHRLGNINVK